MAPVCLQIAGNDDCILDPWLLATSVLQRCIAIRGWTDNPPLSPHRSGQVRPVGDDHFGGQLCRAYGSSIAIADTTIGRGVILNTGCSVDHDCVIDDGVHIGPGARLCGNVKVGPRSLIGVGSAIRPRVTIGSDVVVGAGSAVVADIPDGSVVAGCPARRL